MSVETQELEIIDGVVVEDELEHRLVSDAKDLLRSVELGREDLGYLRLAYERRRVIGDVLTLFARANISVPLPPVLAAIGNLFDQGHQEAAEHMELARWGIPGHLPKAGAWTPKPRGVVS